MPWNWKTIPLMLVALAFCGLAYWVTQSRVYLFAGVVVLLLGIFVWFDSRVTKHQQNEDNETLLP